MSRKLFLTSMVLLTEAGGNVQVLSRHDRKLFEDACRIVRRKAAKLHQRQMGREVSSEGDEGEGRGGGGSASKRSKFDKHSDGKGKGGSGSAKDSRGIFELVDMSELKTICWDCKKVRGWWAAVACRYFLAQERLLGLQGVRRRKGLDFTRASALLRGWWAAVACRYFIAQERLLGASALLSEYAF